MDAFLMNFLHSRMLLVMVNLTALAGGIPCWDGGPLKAEKKKRKAESCLDVSFL